MAQNVSTAVMQRRVEAHDSLDDFPTPPWATRALCEHLQNGPEALDLQYMSCREPAANRGHMVKPLREYFATVEASDVHDYGAGFPVSDYLFWTDPEPVDFTITNPPFRLGEQFVQRMIRTSTIGCAILVRTAFMEGEDRCRDLFHTTPPSLVLQFSERVVIHRSALRQAGSKYIYPQTGEEKTASTATAYAWIVWLTGDYDTRLRWIAPCRKRLERAGDYE